MTRDVTCYELKRWGESIDEKKLSMEHSLLSRFRLLHLDSNIILIKS